MIFKVRANNCVDEPICLFIALLLFFHSSPSIMGDSALVRSEVVETGFGFFTDKDLKSLSCCKVASTLSQDALGRYLHR